MPIHIESATPLFLVYDIPTSLAFYRDLLGFDIIHTSKPFSEAKDDFGWCLLRLNQVELMLNNMYENNVRPHQPDPARTAAHRDTTLYLTCPDLEATRAWLATRGLALPEPNTTYYGMRQLTTHDPDGYTLVFQHPTAP